MDLLVSSISDVLRQYFTKKFISDDRVMDMYKVGLAIAVFNVSVLIIKGLWEYILPFFSWLAIFRKFSLFAVYSAKNYWTKFVKQGVTECSIILTTNPILMDKLQEKINDTNFLYTEPPTTLDGLSINCFSCLEMEKRDVPLVLFFANRIRSFSIKDSDSSPKFKLLYEDTNHIVFASRREGYINNFCAVRYYYGIMLCYEKNGNPVPWEKLFQLSQKLLIYFKYTEPEKKGLTIETYEDGNKRTIGLIEPEHTFSHTFFPEKEEIISRLDLIKNNITTKPWVNKNLGIIAYGKYGTGKTTLIRNICNYLSRSAFIIDFREIDSISALENALPYDVLEKYVIVFDEFDILLHSLKENEKDDGKEKFDLYSALALYKPDAGALGEGSKATEKANQRGDFMKSIKKYTKRMTISNLQTWMDGVRVVKNRVIIATTNFIDEIPACLLRAGRFDMKLELREMRREDIIQMLKDYYDAEKMENENNIANGKYVAGSVVDIIRNCKNVSEAVEKLK